MAFNSKTGDFQLNTDTGNQSVTGLGFQPKLVLFLSTPDTVNITTQTAHYYAMIGAAVSSSSRWVVSAFSVNGSGFADTNRLTKNTACIQIGYSGIATGHYYVADFVSMDADGFTIDITVAPGDAYRVGYIAFGGSDLTNVATGTFTTPTATGNKAVTGVGFQPEALLLAANRSIVALPDDNDGECSFGIGVTDGTNQGCINFVTRDGLPASDTLRLISNTYTLIQNRTSTNQEWACTYSSFDADGFTLNFDDVIGTACNVCYVAFEGTGQMKVGTIQAPTSAGNFSDTTVGFNPGAGIFLSTCQPTFDTIANDCEHTIAFATNVDERFALGGLDVDGRDPTLNFRHSRDDYIMRQFDLSSSEEEAIDFVSWNDDGFTLNSDTALGANPSQLLYLVFEGGGGGAGGGPGAGASGVFIDALLGL